MSKLSFFERYKFCSAQKFQLCLNALPLVVPPAIFTIAFLCPNGIADQICRSANLNRSFVIGCAVYLSFFNSAYSAIVPVWRWKNRMARNPPIYTTCYIIYAFLAVKFFPQYTNAFPNTTDPQPLLPTYLTCWILEIISRQSMVQINTPIHILLNLKDYPTMASILKEYALTTVTMFVDNFIFLFQVSALVIPVSLSHYQLSEKEKIGIYGILFPIMRVIVGRGLVFLGSGMRKAGLFDKNGEVVMQFTCQLGTALNFFATPLYCMLNNITDIPSFCAIYLPHAFLNKFLWARLIPEVAKVIESVSCQKYFCQNSKTVKPTTSTNIEAPKISTLTEKANINDDEKGVKPNGGNQRRPSLGEEVARRLSITASADSVSDNATTKTLEAPSEEENVLEDILKNAGVTAMISEAAEVLGVTLAVFSSFLNLLNSCFVRYAVDINNDFIPSSFTNWAICVFGIIIPLDQFLSVGGFIALYAHDINLDVNFGIGASNNRLNPIGLFLRGDKFSAFLNFMVIGGFITLCLLAASWAEYLNLFNIS